MDPTLLATLSAAIGFIGKAVWDLLAKQRLEKSKIAHQTRISFIERQLREFYWPLLFLLRRNEVVWDKIINNRQTDKLSQELLHKLSRNFFYPNNQKMMQIIEEKYFLALPSPELDEQIRRFLTHQSIFQGIRETLEEDVDPIRFGEPWPERFLPLIEERTRELQRRFDEQVKNDSA